MFRSLLPALVALALLPWSVAAAELTLRAGAAAVDITPQEFPLNMPGGFSANMAEKAHDPFFARAVVFANEQASFALVVVDNLGVAPEVHEEAKAIAAAKTGLAVNRMLICSTHTHSGPTLTRKTVPPRPSLTASCTVAGIAESIVKAHAALQPALVGAAAHPFARRSLQSPLVLEARQDAAQPVR